MFPIGCRDRAVGGSLARAARYRSRLSLGVACRRLAWRRGPDPKGRALSPRARRSVFHSRPGPRGQPAFPAGTSVREADCMEQPQEAEDEEHERVYGRVAAVDVAKASGVVCTRVPGDGPASRRKMHVWTVQATLGAVTELGDHLRLLARLARGAGGLRAESPAGQRPRGPQRAGTGQD